MPNVDNINTVIEMIRAEEVASFNMSKFFTTERCHPCGTAACIAGFAAIASVGSVDKMKDEYGTERWDNIPLINIAMEYLGTDRDNLFYGNDYENLTSGVDDLHRIRPSDAINVLEQLRDTGTYNWEFHRDYRR